MQAEPNIDPGSHATIHQSIKVKNPGTSKTSNLVENGLPAGAQGSLHLQLKP